MDRQGIEQLAARCLEAMHTEGEAALERFCSEHPDQADTLRDVLGQLSDVGVFDAPTPPPRARRVGPYRLLERLGSGGMGVVFRAEHETTGQQVALKLLHPHVLLAQRSRERFRREIKALERLEHPNLCAVLDAQEEGEEPYIAMRYLPGETLAAWLAARRDASAPAPQEAYLDELVVLFEKCARALHAAHEAQIVHRDIKPANILIARDGEPVLLDFGLAADGQLGSSSLTRSGDPVGTPGYMAPEQIDSTRGAIDRRTDVYALGMTAYECMTLQCAFEGATREELYRRILAGGTTEPRSLNPQVSRDLSTVLQRAIAAEPERRFPTALELAEELARVRTGRPVLSRRPGPVVKAWRWVRRNRMASAFFVALTAGLAGSLMLLLANRHQRRLTRAIALAAAADTVKRESPRLSFQLAREARRVAGLPLPRAMSALQNAMGDLHEVARAEYLGGTLEHVSWSADGSRLLAYGDPADPRLLDARTLEVVAILERGTTAVMNRSAAFSPDGTLVAVGGTDGVLRLFDARSGRETKRTRIHEGPINGLCFGHTGIFTVGADGKACVVSVDGELEVVERWVAKRDVKQEHEFLRGLLRCAIPPGEQHVLVSDNGRAWVFRRGEDLPVHEVPPHPGWAMRVIEAGADERFALGWADGIVEVHQLGRGKRKSPNLGGWINSLDFDPRGILLVGHNGGIRLLDESLHPRRTLAANGMVKAWWTEDGRIMATSWDQLVHVFKDTGEEVLTLRGHQGGVKCAALSPDGQRLASCGWDGTVRLWSWSSPVLERRLGPSAVHSLVMLPDGRLLSGSLHHRISVWTEDLVEVVPPSPFELRGILRSMRLDQDGLAVCVTTSAGVWRLDLRSLELVELPDLDLGIGVLTCGLRLGSGDLLICGVVGLVRRDPEGGVVRLPIPPVPHPFLLRRVSGRNDRFLLIRGKHVEIRTTDGKLVRSFVGHKGNVVCAEFFEGGQTLVTASLDGTARVWSVDGQASHVFEGHRGEVRWAGLSPDGKALLTASLDRTLRLWDRNSDRTLLELRGERFRRDGLFASACFSRDGRFAFSGTVGGGLRRWWLDPDELWQVAQALPVPELTHRQKRRFPDLFR